MDDATNSAADKIAHRPAARIELARQVAAFGHAAIKPLYLPNGGSVVALLAFIGRIWADDNNNQQIMSEMADAIFCFVVGLILAAVTTFAGYLQQQFFSGLSPTGN